MENQVAQLLQGAYKVPPAPKSKQRHPQSDPKESFRRKLTQCQYCMKAKLQGVTFFRCNACKIDIYCSKECQKASWPSHKEKCRLNRQELESGENVADMGAKLRAFTSKHRPTIAQAGVRALELYKDINRARTHILRIDLRSRPGSRRPETLFYLVNAEVTPLSEFEPGMRANMESQLEVAREQNIRSGHGMIGALFVMLTSVETRVSNIAPVGFDNSVRGLRPGNWREALTKLLNEGIVR
ncbi:hypothetical protein K474DRAFT_1662849 [Panus rudis PR-1116 ss-1]|nr:hypothetical protein K474DRAFT_1662849 [Panus rudis PR-1116 ss-1]